MKTSAKNDLKNDPYLYGKVTLPAVLAALGGEALRPV